MDKQIEQQVEMLKKYAPDKYKRFQLVGESLMTMEYDNIQKGVDWEGDPILAEEILNRIRNYHCEEYDAIADLLPCELELLERIYGKDWKNML